VSSDLGAVLWKEGRELRAQFGQLRRGGWALIFLLAVFGVFVPWQMGPGWISSPFMAAYWPFVATSMVSSIVADAFAGERERHTLETLLSTPLSDGSILIGKYLAAVLYGSGLTLLAVSLGIVAVNVFHGEGELFLFTAQRLATIVVLTVLTAGASAGAGIFVSLRARTAREAQQVYGIALTVAMLAPTLALQAVSDEQRAAVFEWVRGLDESAAMMWAMFVLAGINAALLMLARRRFRRGLLALD